MPVYSHATTHATAELDLRCPPLPQTLLEAIDLSNQAEPVEVEQAVKLVEKDPVVITRLLRIVNSAYYAQRGQITSIPRAVLILGPSSVVGVVMGMSLMDMRAALDKTTVVPFMNLVRHSVATAFLAQRLIQQDPDFNPNDPSCVELAGAAFTAGMLHDIGKLVLLYNFPTKAVAHYLPAARSDVDPLEAERTALTYNHVYAGSILTQKLNLPATLTEAIYYHHAPFSANGNAIAFKKLLYAIVCASKVASSLGHAFDRPLTWEKCLADPVWNAVIEQRIYGYTKATKIIEELVDAKSRLEAYLESVF